MRLQTFSSIPIFLMGSSRTSCLRRHVLRFVFFFSSRRRHTRCLSDWSSDVCSSDLSGDKTSAEKAFLTLLEKHPEHTQTLNYLGYMWADLGVNLERAADMLVKAVTQEQIGRASCRERV